VAEPGWWSSFFAEPALELWRRAHSTDETRAEASDLARALQLVAGARVLDVPCGNGRLALELASRGVHLCALDAAREFVDEARARAERQNLELELVCGDMRELPWRTEFEAAFCVGNSFGYFEDDGNRAFLAAVARALRPGGCFVLEYPLAAELVLPRRVFRDWHVRGERVLLSDARYDARRGRLETTYTFADLTRAGGALEQRRASYQVYTVREVVTLLREAGFGAIEALASLDGEPFDTEASELFFRAVRR